ncbi:hypothetical protein PENSPDRAFT_688200 [Peniophora sp. CONT]|nr:hypothetical protein PENSPDRAFT_688200 [Peniophora sp. CONT]
MPVLRELSLQLYHEDEDVIRLLPGAFTGSCPLLTSLTLANCFPQWDTHLFSSPLTHLTLATHWIDEDYDPLPTTAEFRAILAALPTLEELVLTNFYPKTPADGEQLNPLTLSNRFRRLTVDISCGSVYEDMNSNFWGSFIFPSTAAIYFEINLDDLESWDAEDGWHFLDPFTQLHDSGSDPQELYLSLDHMTMSYAENPLFSTRLCGLPIPSPSSRHVWAATELPLHLHRLRLAHLSSIRFTSAIQGHYTAPDAWVLAFSVATSIQRVTLTLRHVIPLLDALSATRPDGGMSLFPQMRTLIINSDTDGDEGKNGLELDMSLIDLVDIREGVGAPLQEIMVPEAISSWHIWTHIGEKATVTFYKYT